MYRPAIQLLVLSSILCQVYSHTVLSAINVDGTQYKQFDGSRPHPSSQWDYPISQKNRPDGLQSADMTCGWLPSAAKAANKKIPVKPGSTIGVQWHYELDDSSDTYIIAPDHKGPCIYYMAKSDTGAGAVWFKIYEEGYNSATKQFCVDRLRQNKGYMTFTLPTDITPGNYLLRGEIIALHEGFQLYGAQPYVGCFELTMSGSGTVNPGNLVAFPGAYKATDAGIYFNIYNGFKSYPIPGPAVYVSGSAAPSTPPPSTPTPTPSTPPPSSTPTSVTTGSPSGGSTKQCYLAGTPYVEANLGKKGRCGTKTKTRCPDGECCSKYGYCGTSSDYCTNNQGDYRKYSCSELGASGIPTNIYYASAGEDDVQIEASATSRIYINVGLISAVLLAYFMA